MDLWWGELGGDGVEVPALQGGCLGGGGAAKWRMKGGSLVRSVVRQRKKDRELWGSEA